MTGAALVQVFLATILASAASAKLVDQRGFGNTLKEIDFPLRLISLAGAAIPVLEILTAGLLLWEPLRLWGEVSLLLLLCTFAWAAWKALSKGREVKCNCFGQLAPEVFGWKTVARIILLALLDGFLLLYPGPTRLDVAPMVEMVSAVLLSIGLLMLYAVGTALYEYRRGWAVRS